MDRDVASVTPTSRYCIRTVCKSIDFSLDINIVEYGAGTGVFAEYLLDKMSPGSTLAMFEKNERLFRRLKEIDDGRVSIYNESVEYADELLPDDLIGKIDYIISGIPFSFLDDEITESILSQSSKILKKGGAFLAYQTSGHLKEPLQQVFDNVKTEWEWRNIPPMTVYRAYK